jgi:hypothetical protein
MGDRIKRAFIWIVVGTLVISFIVVDLVYLLG